MDILFIASMSLVVQDIPSNRRLFLDAIGLPLNAADGDDYLHSEAIDGSKHFGLWPLSQAAQACFGTEEWPPGRAIPQACVELEVADADAVAAAARDLEAEGFELLHDAREEPWGQTVTRLLAPDGAIVGISYAPWLHHDR